MSIPNEALQKLLTEIETRALISQQQLSVVKSQITTKQRDIRLIELTSTELSSLPTTTTPVYEGVGKMFVLETLPNVQKRLKDEKGKTETEIGDLKKRLHYLETTFKNASEHMDKILQRG